MKEKEEAMDICLGGWDGGEGSLQGKEIVKLQTGPIQEMALTVSSYGGSGQPHGGMHWHSCGCCHHPCFIGDGTESPQLKWRVGEQLALLLA